MRCVKGDDEIVWPRQTQRDASVMRLIGVATRVELTKRKIPSPEKLIWRSKSSNIPQNKTKNCIFSRSGRALLCVYEKEGKRTQSRKPINGLVHNRFRSKKRFALATKKNVISWVSTRKREGGRKIINRNQKLILFCLLGVLLSPGFYFLSLARDSSRGRRKRVSGRWKKKRRARREEEAKEESQINTRIPRATSQVVSTLLSFLTLYIFILMADNKIKINETIERGEEGGDHGDEHRKLF